MADKNKKGIEKKEYPKLIKVEGKDKKVLVNSKEEEEAAAKPAITAKKW